LKEALHEGFRQAPHYCKDFPYTRLYDYIQTPEGSYVIRILGNLMKPEDPIRSGF